MEFLFLLLNHIQSEADERDKKRKKFKTSTVYEVITLQINFDWKPPLYCLLAGTFSINPEKIINKYYFLVTDM